MNNGMLTIVLVVVAIFIILTVVNVGLQQLKQDYVTETALLSVGVASERVQGVFIRDEKVRTYDGSGVISYEVADGGKVGIDSVIANVYSSENQIEIKQRITALKNELALLERISNPGTTQTAQPSNISELFTQHYKSFLYEREQGRFSDLQAEREEMVVLLSIYQLVTGKDSSYKEKMERIRSEIEALEQSQENPLLTITADEAAYFVSYADGYEDILRMENVNELTPEQLAEIQDNPHNAGNTVGKLIDSYQWVLVAVVDNTEKLYKTDNRVKLKFSSTSETVHGTITMLNAAAGVDKTVIAVTCESMTYDLVQHRTEMVEIIRIDENGEDEYQGIMVPRDALHFKEIEVDGEIENVKGVYILNGEQPEFRRLNIIYEGADYVISAQTTNSSYLMLYDAIIRKGIDADGQ
ncbi:MAG: hypothetical protein K2I93_07635 [Oscillospiraceae bacterium]|nr:hypothetical protein [Oscillospiraceae bacterium]